MNDSAWMDRAACRTAPDKRIFYSSDKLVLSQAKRYCQRCTVQHQCLEYALANDELGIWGGTTEWRRERLSRK